MLDGDTSNVSLTQFNRELEKGRTQLGSKSAYLKDGEVKKGSGINEIAGTAMGALYISMAMPLLLPFSLYAVVDKANEQDKPLNLPNYHQLVSASSFWNRQCKQTEAIREHVIISMGHVMGLMLQLHIATEEELHTKIAGEKISNDVLALTMLHVAYQNLFHSDLHLATGVVLRSQDCPPALRALYGRISDLSSALREILPRQREMETLVERYLSSILHEFNDAPRPSQAMADLESHEVAHVKLVIFKLKEAISEINRSYGNALKVDSERLRDFCRELKKHYVKLEEEPKPRTVRLCDVFVHKAEIDREECGGHGPAFPIMRK